MDRIHAEGLYHWKKQRGKDHNGRSYIHEGSCDQQNYIHDQQDDVLIAGDAQKGVGNSLRNLGKGHNPAENVGNTDQENHHAAHFSTVNYDFPEGFEGNIPVADSKNQGVNNSDGRTFRCGEDTGDNTADYHDNQGKRRNGSKCGSSKVFPVKFSGSSLIPLFFAIKMATTIQQTAHRIPGI